MPDFHQTVYLLGNGTLLGCTSTTPTPRRAGRPHGEIKDASYGSGLSFRDPDGIALEFFAPARLTRHQALRLAGGAADVCPERLQVAHQGGSP
jgi:hypothetical protein